MYFNFTAALKFSTATSLVIILLFSTACNSDNKATGDDKNPAVEQDGNHPVAANTPVNILGQQIHNIKGGSPISSIDMVLKKGTINNAEGDFEVFYIISEEGNNVGYISPSPADNKLVGTIYMTSPDYVLPNGLRIGSTWKDIQEKAGKVEVHGSEMESRTYADLGEFQLKLDIPFNTYEVDESQIPASTVVTEILIKK